MATCEVRRELRGKSPYENAVAASHGLLFSVLTVDVRQGRLMPDGRRHWPQRDQASYVDPLLARRPAESGRRVKDVAIAADAHSSCGRWETAVGLAWPV